MSATCFWEDNLQIALICCHWNSFVEQAKEFGIVLTITKHNDVKETSVGSTLMMNLVTSSSSQLIFFLDCWSEEVWGIALAGSVGFWIRRCARPQLSRSCCFTDPEEGSITAIVHQQSSSYITIFCYLILVLWLKVSLLYSLVGWCPRLLGWCEGVFKNWLEWSLPFALT